jgi:hypothetical protein
MFNTKLVSTTIVNQQEEDETIVPPTANNEEEKEKIKDAKEDSGKKLEDEIIAEADK